MFRFLMRELREKAGYSSQQAFADAFGVAQTTVASWECGKREPKFDTMQRLADFFGVTVDYLLGRDTEIKKDPGIVSDAEIDEGAMLLRSLPENLQEEAMRYLRFLVAEEKKQAGEDK